MIIIKLKNKIMEQLSPSKSSTVLSWGLYLGIASILFTLLISYSGLMGNKVVGLLWYVILAVVLVLGIKHYKEKENNGYLKYSQGLGLGTLTGLVAGVINGLFTYVFYTIIDPSVHEQLVVFTQEEALKNGATEAGLEQAESFMNILLSPGMLSLSNILSTVFMAFIFSLVIAAILKKDQEPEF